MHSFKAIIGSALMLARLVAGQSTVAFTNSSYDGITAGQPVIITYSAPDLSSPAQIALFKGDPANLNSVSVLTADAVNGIYIWVPAPGLTTASDYALQIVQGTQVNYSPLFAILSTIPATSVYNTSVVSVTPLPTGYTTGYVTVNGTLCPTTFASAGTGLWPIGGNSTFVSPTLSATTPTEPVTGVPTDVTATTAATDEPTTQATSTGGASKVDGAVVAVGFGVLGGLLALF